MAGVWLFVYGSLKRGGLHHEELGARDRDRGARFVAEARTVAGYGLVSVGDYLALVKEPGTGSVPGEVFEVDEALLLALDAFEGDDYERAQLVVEIAGQNLPANAVALAYLRKAR